MYRGRTRLFDLRPSDLCLSRLSLCPQSIPQPIRIRFFLGRIMKFTLFRSTTSDSPPFEWVRTVEPSIHLHVRIILGLA
jgi:hypothetical protein